MLLSRHIVRKFQKLLLKQADVSAMLSACVLAIELPDVRAFLRESNGFLKTFGNFLSKDDLIIP